MTLGWATSSMLGLFISGECATFSEAGSNLSNEHISSKLFFPTRIEKNKVYNKVCRKTINYSRGNGRPKRACDANEGMQTLRKFLSLASLDSA